jgi:hypothetical protein
MKKGLVFTAIIVLSAASASAAVNDSAGIIFPETSIGAGARAAGMGGAFTAVADDASAAYWNPAGLSQVRDASVILTYDKWFMDSFYQHLMGALPLPAGTLGVDIFYMNFGTFDKVDNNGTTYGSIIPYTMEGTLSYGLGLGGGLSAGISAKIMNQSIGTASNMGFAGDAALYYRSGIFSAGLVGSNMGSGGAFSLPANVRAGIAVNVVNISEQNLLLAVDAGYAFNADPDICAGAEYTIQKIFIVRAGYNFSPNPNNPSGLTGISAGAGLNLGPVGFDYAFVPYGELGTSHRAALRYYFNNAAPAAAPRIELAAKQNVPVELSKPEAKLYDMYFTAGTLENSGKLAAAEAKYKEILKTDSTYAPAWKRLGAVFFKEKKKEQAIKCFEAYLKLKPDDDAVVNWLKKNK